MKKTMIFKLLACFMAMLMLISCLSAGFVSACPDVELFSYDDFEYEIMTDYDDDYNEYQYISIIDYTGNSAHVEIPPEIDGVPVTEISYMTFCDNLTITSVCVPSSVTYIGDGAFENCENLAEINLPSTLTYIGDNILLGTKYAADNYEDGVLYLDNYLIHANSLELPENVTVKDGTTLISAYAFFSSDIKSVSLPSSLRKINSSAFAYCEKLTDIEIAEGVEEFDYGTFSDCYSLTEISLPASLKYIGTGCFSFCTSLTSFELPENIEEITDGLLSGCENLTSFEISDNVYYIGYEAFANTGIKSLHIPASVTYISSMANSSALENITVDSKNETYFAKDNVLFERYFIDGSIRITRIGCNESLQNYVVPDDVVTIDYGALKGNNTIKSLTLGKNVENVYDYDAPSLESFNVHPENKYFSSVDGVLLTDEGKTLEFYPIGKKDKEYTVPAEVTSISSECFYYNPYLTELTIPNTVKKLNHTVVEGCDSLTTINMSPCEATYSWPFLFCDKLTTINFDGVYNSWVNMDIECYNDSTNGIYLYCKDGTVELQAPELEYELGDVNMDNTINIKDATAIQKYLANLIDLNDTAYELADYNMDTTVSIKDATTIQKFLAGLI